MPIHDANLYKKARISAGLTQERAAERLHISVKCLQDYEAGQRIPAVDVVSRMCAEYAAPWLGLEHLQCIAGDLGVIPNRPLQRNLQHAAIALHNRIDRLDSSIHQLLFIAEDGIVTAAEKPRYDAIIQDLEGIVSVAMGLKFYTNFAKENRPSVGADRRSCGNTGRVAVSIGDKDMVPQSDAVSSPSFAGGEDYT